MEKKNYLILDDEFLLYCKLNNIQDIEKLAKETFNKGFTLLKYGELPKSVFTKKVSETDKKDLPLIEKEVKDTKSTLYEE